MKTNYKLGVVVASLMTISSSNVLAEQSAADSAFTWGGDFRFRIVSLKDIPLEAGRNAGTKIDQSLFTRFRTRIWGQYVFNKDYKVKVRAVNEFRNYDNGKPNHANTWKALDEIVFDELYLDINNQFNGKLDLRLGRQGLIYGTGKVFLEASPLDGSRTIYHNAAKAVLKVNPTNSLDVFYFNNPKQDDFAIHSSERNLMEWAEEGAAIYAKNKDFNNYPFEYYYVYKDEKRSIADGNPVHLNTIGARFMPKFTATLNANFELASQWGSQNGNSKEGMMFDSVINWNFMASNSLKPTLSIGYYYLSGDDASTTKDEAWNPVLSRWPQFSELYLYSFIDGAGGHGIGNWNNVSMPWIGLGLNVFKGAKFDLRYFNISANETDQVSHPGLGDKRGDLVTAKLKYKINKSWYGHLVAEFLNPGDYYANSLNKTAHFLRAEINYKF
ncbi:MAG: hypothetical protein QM479_01175 [Pseudomonadota bacterium]